MMKHKWLYHNSWWQRRNLKGFQKTRHSWNIFSLLEKIATIVITEKIYLINLFQFFILSDYHSIFYSFKYSDAKSQYIISMILSHKISHSYFFFRFCLSLHMFKNFSSFRYIHFINFMNKILKIQNKSKESN